MALTDDNSMVMPVTPMYGGNGGFGNGFGGDGWWIILLLLACNGGWGFGGFGGYGAMMGMDYGLYPWLNNSQNINGGFRDQQLSTLVGGIQNAVTSGFGDVQTALCGGFAGVNATINGAQNALAQQMYTNQISDLERSFAAQTASTQGMNAIQAQLAQCCCDNRAATQDVKYTIATEACNTREANTANTQAILDKLCALELDGYKRENDQLRAENSNLRNQGFIANEINQQNEVFYNRLKNCPVNAVPVAGNTPLFSCNPSFNSPNYGCGCGNGF